jgi:SAM-dependent methyltransferase
MCRRSAKRMIASTRRLRRGGSGSYGLLDIALRRSIAVRSDTVDAGFLAGWTALRLRLAGRASFRQRLWHPRPPTHCTNVSDAPLGCCYPMISSLTTVPTADSVRFFERDGAAYRREVGASEVFAERFLLFDLHIARARARFAEAPHYIDLGCGPGTLLQSAARRGYRCVGIDGSKRMLQAAAVATQGFGAEVELVHSELPLPAQLLERLRGSAQVVVASSVIEYLDDERAFANQVATLLAPGGIALVSFPNRNSLYRRAQSLLPSRLQAPYLSVQHRQHDRRAAASLLEAAGLSVQEVRYFGIPDPLRGVWRSSHRRPPWLANLILVRALLPPSGVVQRRQTAAPDQPPRGTP